MPCKNTYWYLSNTLIGLQILSKFTTTEATVSNPLDVISNQAATSIYSDVSELT